MNTRRYWCLPDLNLRALTWQSICHTARLSLQCSSIQLHQFCFETCWKAAGCFVIYIVTMYPIVRLVVRIVCNNLPTAEPNIINDFRTGQLNPCVEGVSQTFKSQVLTSICGHKCLSKAVLYVL